MVTIDFVISNTVNFPGSAGLPIINEAPDEFIEDFPALYGNVDFAFDVSFLITGTGENSEQFTITDVQVLNLPEFTQYEIISENTIRISVKPNVVVFPGEVFELLLTDQTVLPGVLSSSGNTNIIEGLGTNFTEVLQTGDNIVIGSSSERFTVSNIISNTELQTEQHIETGFVDDFFLLTNISEIDVNETVDAGSYKTIFQWIDPPIKEIEGTYTFVISYFGSITGEGSINSTHVQEFYWYYIPSLQKFDSLTAGSSY